MSTFTLYRFFASDDTLLYVGLTVNPGRRMEKHRGTQEWWPEVARIEMEQHPDIETLRAAEREAIETEKPLHNIRFNGGQARAGERSITWVCEVCRFPIADGDGYVAVCYADVYAFDEAVRAHEARMEADHPEWGTSHLKMYCLNELYDYPNRVRWQTLHRRCDPDPKSDDYWIAVEEVRTPSQMLRWAAHLSTKKWIANTTFGTLLRQAASDAA